MCLYENYPGLRFHIEKANEINEKYYKEYPEFRIRFQPNFTWSSDGLYINRIGIRATNSMCNLKKENRAEVLEAYGFTLEKDINASVPRMTLSLNMGKWIDEITTIDFSKREENSDKAIVVVKEKGYDIKDNSVRLLKLYKQFIEG